MNRMRIIQRASLITSQYIDNQSTTGTKQTLQTSTRAVNSDQERFRQQMLQAYIINIELVIVHHLLHLILISIMKHSSIRNISSAQVNLSIVM